MPPPFYGVTNMWKTPNSISPFHLNRGWMCRPVSVMCWMRVNKLRLNPEKTKAVFVDGSHVLAMSGQPVPLAGIACSMKERVLSLRVFLDTLGSGKHTQKIYSL